MATQRQNPFLSPELMENVAPGPRNTSLPGPPSAAPETAPTRTPARTSVPQPQPQPQPQSQSQSQDPEFQRRRAGWSAFLNDPKVRAGLMQFGMAMLGGQGFGNSVGQGFQAAGRFANIEQNRAAAQSEAAREREVEERQLANQERRTDIYAQTVAAQSGGRTGKFTDEQKRALKVQDQEDKRLYDEVTAEYDRLNEEATAAQEQAALLRDPTLAPEVKSPQARWNRAEALVYGRRSGTLATVDRIEAMEPGFADYWWTIVETQGYGAAFKALESAVELMNQGKGGGGGETSAALVQPEEAS